MTNIRDYVSEQKHKKYYPEMVLLLYKVIVSERVCSDCLIRWAHKVCRGYAQGLWFYLVGCSMSAPGMHEVCKRFADFPDCDAMRCDAMACNVVLYHAMRCDLMRFLCPESSIWGNPLKPVIFRLGLYGDSLT